MTLAKWQHEAQDIGGEVEARPHWTGDGVPMCGLDMCPRFDARQGCDALFEPSNVCTPVVAQMARAINARCAVGVVDMIDQVIAWGTGDGEGSER